MPACHQSQNINHLSFVSRYQLLRTCPSRASATDRPRDEFRLCPSRTRYVLHARVDGRTDRTDRPDGPDGGERTKAGTKNTEKRVSGASERVSNEERRNRPSVVDVHARTASVRRSVVRWSDKSIRCPPAPAGRARGAISLSVLFRLFVRSFVRSVGWYDRLERVEWLSRQRIDR